MWDGAKQIIADVKNGAFYEADCYIRGTSLVAKYSYANGAKSEYTYYTQNAHGDVVNLTDIDGIVIKTYKYDAFGVEKNIDDADTNAFRYCGEYYDSETGTIYLRARHYNPSNGRFTQRDSFAGKQGDPLSLNLYTYCGNNLILNVDPDGHFWHIVAGAAVGALIGGVVKVASNLASGEDWNAELGTAMLAGAASGALAATGVGMVGMIVGNAAISMAENATNQIIENKGFNNFDVGDMAIDGVIGGISGAIGGAGKGSKHLTNLGKQTVKRTANTTIHKGFKAGVKEAGKAFAYYGKNTKSFYKPLFKGIVKDVISATGTSVASDYMKKQYRRIL